MSEIENQQPTQGPVRVTIFGQAYNLRSPNTSEHVLLIARAVDERMRQIASHLAVHDVAKVAVLAALNFADEVRLQREYYEGELRSLSSEAESVDEEQQEESPVTRPEARSGASWFETVFDEDAFDDVTSARMSTQLMSKLHERRPARRERPASTPENKLDEN
jgi:cell division protein ZapA